MTPEELARFLREDADDLRIMARGFANGQKVLKCLDAIDAAVGLLRVAADDLDWSLDYVPANMDRTTQAGAARLRECKKRLATLRLVVGEVESHHSIPGG